MSLKEYIEERVILIARYIIDNNATVRQAAKKFGVSKSTIHKDVTDRLRHVNNALWKEVQELLNKNKQERHLRGGEATRKKYTACRHLGDEKAVFCEQACQDSIN